MDLGSCSSRSSLEFRHYFQAPRIWVLCPGVAHGVHENWILWETTSGKISVQRLAGYDSGYTNMRQTTEALDNYCDLKREGPLRILRSMLAGLSVSVLGVFFWALYTGTGPGVSH